MCRRKSVIIFWLIIKIILNITFSVPYKECEGVQWFYAKQYEMLKSKLINCTHITTSLSLFRLQPGHDLSFLSTIEVIDGYLQIRVIGSPVIPLYNLRVIRGNRLVPGNNNVGYALVIEYTHYEGREFVIKPPDYNTEEDPILIDDSPEMAKLRKVGGIIEPINSTGFVYELPSNNMVEHKMLKYIQFYSLVEIARGGVYINDNPGICYLSTNIDWEEILLDKSDLSLVYISKNKYGTDCAKYRKDIIMPKYFISPSNPDTELPPKPECDAKCDGNCWDYDHCQIIYKKMCHPACRKRGLNSGICNGPLVTDCCYHTCMGGCTGPTEADCFLCRGFHKSVYDAYWNNSVDICVFDCSIEPPTASMGGKWNVIKAPPTPHFPIKVYDVNKQITSYPNTGFMRPKTPLETSFPFISNYQAGITSKYTLGFNCASRCAPQYFISNGLCVSECAKGLIGVPSTDKRLAGSCKLIPEHCLSNSTYPKHIRRRCPRICKMERDIFFSNYKYISGCSEIKGRLGVLEVTFDARRIPYNDSHDYLNRYMHFAELDSLRSIRLISDHVRIQILRPHIKNLDFLDNLETISGQIDLIEDEFSLLVFKTDLEFLGLRSLTNIPGGGLVVLFNSKICYTDTLLPERYYNNVTSKGDSYRYVPRYVWNYLANTDPFRKDATAAYKGNDTYVYKNQIALDGQSRIFNFHDNRSPLDCIAEGLICHDICFPKEVNIDWPKTIVEDPYQFAPYGCWGPGLHRCVKCSGSVLTLELEMLNSYYNPFAVESDDAATFNGQTLQRTMNIVNYLAKYFVVINDNHQGPLNTSINILKQTVDALLSEHSLAFSLWDRFYGKKINICVPSCGTIWDSDTQEDIYNYVELYKSLFAAIEQIIPLESVSLSGDNFTFADMKLQILEYITESLGPTLGLLTVKANERDKKINPALKLYTFPAPKVSWVINELSQKSLSPSKSHVCLLCDVQCKGGCTGPGPRDCLDCKHYKQVLASEPWYEIFVCVQECPDEHYYDFTLMTCHLCPRENCSNITVASRSRASLHQRPIILKCSISTVCILIFVLILFATIKSRLRVRRRRQFFQDFVKMANEENLKKRRFYDTLNIKISHFNARACLPLSNQTNVNGGGGGIDEGQTISPYLIRILGISTKVNKAIVDSTTTSSMEFNESKFDIVDSNLIFAFLRSSNIIHNSLHFAIETPGMMLNNYLTAVSPFNKFEEDPQDNQNNFGDDDYSSVPRPLTPEEIDKVCDVLKNKMPHWFCQLAEGMKYLHSKGIYHGSLNLNSIYLYKSEVIRINDYYYCPFVSNSSPDVKKSFIKNYYRWLPLENWKDEELFLSQPSDSWAFAVVLWEIYNFGATPYALMNFETYKTEVDGGYRLPHPLFAGIDVYKMMIMCWIRYPNVRLKFDNISLRLMDCAKDIPDNYKYSMMDDFNSKLLELKLQQQQQQPNCSINKSNGISDKDIMKPATTSFINSHEIYNNTNNYEDVEEIYDPSISNSNKHHYNYISYSPSPSPPPPPHKLPTNLCNNEMPYYSVIPDLDDPQAQYHHLINNNSLTVGGERPTITYNDTFNSHPKNILAVGSAKIVPRDTSNISSPTIVAEKHMMNQNAYLPYTYLSLHNLSEFDDIEYINYNKPPPNYTKTIPSTSFTNFVERPSAYEDDVVRIDSNNHKRYYHNNQFLSNDKESQF